MPKLLLKYFYRKKTLFVAQALLGKFLVRKIGNKIIAGMITETEAYCGPNDLASHASRGRTTRTEIMFGSAGRAYIYLIYGMYYCLNIVTEKKDYPAAVLIRGIKINGVDYKITNGPGKLCKFLTIDKSFNGVDITNTSPNPSLERRGNFSTIYSPSSSPGLRPPSPCLPVRQGEVLKVRVDKNILPLAKGEAEGVINTLWIEDRGIIIKLSQIKKAPRIGVDYAEKYKNKKWRFLYNF